MKPGMHTPCCGSLLKPLAVMRAAHFLDVGIFSTSSERTHLLAQKNRFHHLKVRPQQGLVDNKERPGRRRLQCSLTVLRRNLSGQPGV